MKQKIIYGHISIYISNMMVLGRVLHIYMTARSKPFSNLDADAPTNVGIGLVQTDIVLGMENIKKVQCKCLHSHIHTNS